MTLDGWSFYGNGLQAWIIALTLFFVVLAVLAGAKRILGKKLIDLARGTKNHLDDLFADLIPKTRLYFFVALALYAASIPLDLPNRALSLIQGFAIVAGLVQVAVWAMGIVAWVVQHYVRLELGESEAHVATTAALTFMGKVIVWTVVLLLALENLGVDVTTLIAGLGVGGIAVALAAQNILGDLFASLSIMLDKPFVVGDFIIVGDLLGTVEYIGLKSTRVRSLHGEQLVFSNGDLLTSRIRNYKRMQERRIVFSFGVTYETPYEKLAAIPFTVRKVIESIEDTRFDRAHFKEYGESSLNFEVVYYMRVPDYNAYMDTQQIVNLELYRRFESEGISFAYPTRTVHLQQPAGLPQHSS